MPRTYFPIYSPLSLWSSCVNPLILVVLILLHIRVDVDFDAVEFHAVQGYHKIIEDFVLPKTVPAFQPRYLIHRVKRRRQRKSQISLVTSGSINQRLRLNYKRFTLHTYVLTPPYFMVYAG